MDSTDISVQAPSPPQDRVVLSAPQPTPEGFTGPPYVYALGRIEPRILTSGVEKELAQVTGRTDTAGFSDRQAFHSLLSERTNRYLVRQLAWVLTVEGLDTYLLHPRDPVDFDLLIEAVRPTPRATDLDVVIGVRGPIASPDAAGGLSLPLVVFEQVYSFDVDSLLAAIPRPESVAEDDFTPTAEELFTRLMQIADNAGATDEHRALNYLAVRYPAIYARAAQAHAEEAALTSVEVRPSRLSGPRRVVDVVFSFTNRKTDVTEASFVRVDVTEMFPYLVTKLSPFYQR